MICGKSKCSRRRVAPWRRAFTLVEVLAAVMIVGGSVTAMLVAQSRSLESIGAGRHGLTARHLARELILTWDLHGEDVTLPSSGAIAGDENWSWRRTVQTVEAAPGVRAREILLTLTHHDRTTGKPPWSREYRWLVMNDRG